LFSFILYTGIIGGAIAGIGNLYTTLMSAVGATERILDILETDSETTTDLPNKDLPRLKGDINFKNIDFTYPTRPDIPVLKSFNLDIKSGTKVALVGPSGAGKSTILQLLMRYYAEYEGDVSVDGTLITEYDIHHFRSNIGLVPQEVLLFGGSIRENILYGNPDASEEEVISAAQKSNSWDFISQFPEGLDTLIGDRGIKLSGGQRQRLAIARVILKDPSILLLDEATSALDASSEKLVQEALNRLMEGRTAIIVAHRLATIKDVDCIYVIDKGRVIEKGNHKELSNKEDGAYSTLAKLQFETI
jgi:ABC-type bacteriocin/lantibiotic exporters, contain an N-terminal double-glycine peptidase domain